MKTINITKCLVFLLICGCSEKDKNLKIEHFPNGQVSQISLIKNGVENGRRIEFDSTGNIKAIENIVNGLKQGEQLNFHEVNGLLKSKLTFKNNLANGVAYWFYASGSLKASRNYINDKEWYLGFDYWDDSFVIVKSLLRFNEQGHVFYKGNFDSTGKPKSAEGDSVRAGIKSL